MKIKTMLSPNFFSREENIPEMITLHQSNVPEKRRIKYYLSKESRDSVHFYITKSGDVINFLPITLSCCKDVCSECDPKRIDHYSRSLSDKVRDMGKDPSYYTVSVEFEGVSSGGLTKPQFERGAEVIKYIKAEVNKLYGHDIKINQKNVIGAYKLMPSLHPFSPGLDFPLKKLIKAST